MPPITAQAIVQAIGDGVAQALSTNQLFLGVEEDMFKNADIHPEYVTTVEVAKQLTAPDRVVSLESHMKELRGNARFLARGFSRVTNKTFPDIDRILTEYRFGKKDSQRLDILVRSSTPSGPPLLIAEAKLGVKNLMGVIHDITRVVRLLTMYNDLQLLDKYNVYGAVLFHFWEEGNDVGSPNQQANNLLIGINEHLLSLKPKKPWMNSRAGLLTHGARIQAITGYRETHDDGYEEDVFAKDSFTFAPGLVLLGNAADVSSASF
jgi:hypothetical protein